MDVVTPFETAYDNGMTNAAPATTNLRTRALAKVITNAGATPWVGGRTVGAYTEHGFYLRADQSGNALDAIYSNIDWEGVRIVDGGNQYNPASMSYVDVYWIRVPK